MMSAINPLFTLWRLAAQVQTTNMNMLTDTAQVLSKRLPMLQQAYANPFIVWQQPALMLEMMRMIGEKQLAFAHAGSIAALQAMQSPNVSDGIKSMTHQLRAHQRSMRPVQQAVRSNARRLK